MSMVFSCAGVRLHGSCGITATKCRLAAADLLGRRGSCLRPSDRGIEQVVLEAEKRGVSLPSLPADMVEAAKSFEIQKLLLLRYLDIQASAWPLGLAIKPYEHAEAGHGRREHASEPLPLQRDVGDGAVRVAGDAVKPAPKRQPAGSQPGAHDGSRWPVGSIFAASTSNTLSSASSATRAVLRVRRRRRRKSTAASAARRGRRSWLAMP
ncbi:hypothetical protein C2845_PM15G01520 [Panicum miliaceum]|uniref:Uncharacterized protein n=1 Tax=Panicum miliaceum TaxID=4540 RepID=A0A3L6Q612_PANMI|nr:hypothetical protein C2845_PM15G01520 [Panicum miliaceum]